MKLFILHHLHEKSVQAWYAATEFLRRLGLPESWAEPFSRLSNYPQLWLIRHLMPDKRWARSKDGVYLVEQ